jgi:hypothetical protein
MRHFPTLLVLLACLAACGSPPDIKPTGTARLQPYLTASASKTPTLIPVLTRAVLPTPTTYIYVVVQGDTLIGIAARVGVTLADLTAANPGIQPTTLLPGTKLIIPVGNTSPGEPTPTPVPLNVQQVHCWPQTDGGLWCFALIGNNDPETLENLSVQITLFNKNGKELDGQLAFAPLDILPSGQSMPIAVYFPSPVSTDVSARVEVLTSFRLLPTDPRYLPAAVQDTLVSVDWSGRTAQASGRVVLTAASGTANRLWVLGVAYDSAGEVVGIRRWEAPAPLAAGQILEFKFEVASVGPSIERVEFVVEAKPELSPPSPSPTPK